MIALLYPTSDRGCFIDVLLQSDVADGHSRGYGPTNEGRRLIVLVAVSNWGALYTTIFTRKQCPDGMHGTQVDVALTLLTLEMEFCFI